MKLGSSLLFLALTAGLAALAVTTAVLEVGMADSATIEDVDAWFV